MDQKAVVGAKPLIEPNSVESAPAVFVDGNAGITIGASVSKIHFHEVIGIDAATGGERRKVILNLHIPTTVLVEFCKNTLGTIAVNSSELQVAIAKQTEAMVAALPDLKKAASKAE